MLAAAVAIAPPPRTAAAVRQFRREHACPVTGRHRGPCPGYEVDHITPLCAGGADAPANMQWLAVSEHRAKTRTDRATCRRIRHLRKDVE